MLMSTISVNLFLSISNAFKQFDLAYVNNGGPRLRNCAFVLPNL